MDTQNVIKLIAAVSGAMCMMFGIVALFKGLKAHGMVDISAIAKGKIKTGSAGVMLLFFGAMILAILVAKGERTSRYESYDVSIPSMDKALSTNDNKIVALQQVIEQLKYQMRMENANARAPGQIKGQELEEANAKKATERALTNSPLNAPSSRPGSFRLYSTNVTSRSP
jgi:hypothetical protein